MTAADKFVEEVDCLLTLLTKNHNYPEYCGNDTELDNLVYKVRVAKTHFSQAQSLRRDIVRVEEGLLASMISEDLKLAVRRLIAVVETGLETAP